MTRISAAFLIVGLVAACASDREVPPVIQADEGPAVTIGPIEFESDLSPEGLISGDAVVLVHWSGVVPEDAVVSVDGEPLLTESTAWHDVLQATPVETLSPGWHDLEVESGEDYAEVAFLVTTPCEWLSGEVWSRVTPSSGRPVSARADWPSRTYGAVVEAPALTVRGDGQAILGSTTASSSSVSFASDELFYAGRTYEAVFSYTCGEQWYEVRSQRRTATPDCQSAAAQSSVEVSSADGQVLDLEATWPTEPDAGYGEVVGAELVLVEREPWCTQCTGGVVDSIPVEQLSAGALTAVFDQTLPNHTYQATLELDCGSRSASLDGDSYRATAVLGTLSDPSLLPGRSFASRGDAFALVEPSGPDAAALENVLHMQWLPTVTIDHVDPSTGAVDSRMAWTRQYGDTPVQKPCSNTFDLPTGTLADGQLSLGPADLAVVTGLGVAHLYDFEMTAWVGADATALRDIQFSGYFDMRDLAGELGYATGEEFCADADGFGIACEACPGDGPAVCVRTVIDRVDAFESVDWAPVDLVCDQLRSEVIYAYEEERLVTTDRTFLGPIVGLNLEGEEVWRIGPPTSTTYVVAMVIEESTGSRRLAVEWYSPYLRAVSFYDLRTGASAGSAWLGQGDSLESYATGIDLLSVGGGCGPICSVTGGERSALLGFVGMVVLFSRRRR